MAAVSSARMPSFFSLCVTSKPGVPFSTRKDLMPPRPALLSTVAHTTTASQRQPVVTKIFSPLRIHSLVFSSRTAVVCTALESEPQPGSVIAMASVIGRQRAICSGVPEAMSAALPRPPRPRRMRTV
jgi:hypothetical protein